MDQRLLHLLVCPLCKGPLEMVRNADHLPDGLACRADRLVYPIRDGIPVMLESEASTLPDDGATTAPVLPGQPA